GIANVASTDGFLFGLSTGAVSANVTIQNSSFYNNHSYGTQLDTVEGQITGTFTNNKFGRDGDGVAAGCGSALCPNTGGIALTTSNGGILDYTISGNSIYGSLV